MCEVREVNSVLERNFKGIYTKFKMGLYSKVFNQDVDAKESLSAVEVLCAEVICALKNPTINEFAGFVGISAPNAAYKVNCLVNKGYITRTRSESDKREYHLQVTDKYMMTYGLTYDYMDTVMNRIRERFPKEDVQKLDEILGVVYEELMPEIQIKGE